MKTQATSYWVTTSILAFAVISGGAAELAHQRANVDGLAHLGYPVYLATILGFWKLLGGITIVAPRFPRLKEWAYAGIFFNMTGAAVSHAVTADATWHVIITGALAILTIASWALRPSSRKLGVLLLAAAGA